MDSKPARPPAAPSMAIGWCPKRSPFRRVQVCVLALGLHPLHAACSLSGNGTEASPFLISSYGDIRMIGSTTVCNLGSVYRLTTDIDAADTGEGFSPIGPDKYNVFAGSLHGGGHAIRNLTIQRPASDLLGLFGYLSGTVDSLDMIDATIVGSGMLGIVAARNQGTIRYCSTTGTVTGGTITGGREHVGGIAGENVGTISDCHSSAQVYSTDIVVGGLCGSNWGTIIRCWSSGNTSGFGQVGGIAGTNDGALLECYATGDVTAISASGHEFGGVVGINGSMARSSARPGVARYCFSSGNVAGAIQVGGVAGANRNGDTLDQTYATGHVSGLDQVGGLVGINSGFNSYFNPVPVSTTMHGFWNTGTTGRDSGCGNCDTGVYGQWLSNAGLTTAQMMDSASFVGFSFDPDSAWSIDQGKAYPILRHLPAPPADSTTAVRTTSSNRSRGASLHREGSALFLSLPQAARVRTVDAAGRRGTPWALFSAGTSKLELPTGGSILFLQIRANALAQTLPIPVAH